jgi:hypothetical protein
VKAIIKSVTLLSKLLYRLLEKQGQELRLNITFHTLSKKLFLASNYERQISSPLPPKGDMMDPALSSLNKLEP